MGIGKTIQDLLHGQQSQAVQTWLEHALVIGGIGAITDLTNNEAGLGYSHETVIIVGFVLGALVRFLNKADVKLVSPVVVTASPPPAPPTPPAAPAA